MLGKTEESWRKGAPVSLRPQRVSLQFIPGSTRGSATRRHRLKALAAAWPIRETLSPLNNVLNNAYNCTDQEKNAWRKGTEKIT
jgi:hypothetical protein